MLLFLFLWFPTTPTLMSFSVKQVDYRDHQDAADFVLLLREYARFEQCDRPALKELPAKLADWPHAFSVLAHADSSDRRPVGLINCFFGFSTFQLRPLVNIHDVIVTGDFRGRGVAGRMLEEVERIARTCDCCRLTLEVYGDNGPARRAYEKYGFTRDPAHPDVDVHFLRKSL
jgi:ribosomal protein S18 acetylase RimI-like enzyme